MEVSIREMKNNLSRYLKRVQAGEEVIITDRGRPVARLLSVPSASENPLEAAVRRLQAQPWMRRGSGGKPKGLKRPIKLKPGSKTLAETIVEDRG